MINQVKKCLIFTKRFSRFRLTDREIVHKYYPDEKLANLSQEIIIFWFSVPLEYFQLLNFNKKFFPDIRPSDTQIYLVYDSYFEGK